MSSDRLTDSLGRGWTLGAPLARGTWGRTRLLRSDDGRQAVLHEPLTEADLPGDVPKPEDLLRDCRACADEQARLLTEAAHPFLPRLEATIDLGGGRTGLVLPRYTTLAKRLAEGMALSEVLRVVVTICQLLQKAERAHGDLRPDSILFSESGELFLAGLATPSLAAHRVRLASLAGLRGWLPPEAVDAVPASPGWDTWALGQIIHAAATLGADRALQLAAGGLDKVALAAVRDRATSRLADEGSNPRFRSRVADRLGTLLSRALSAQHEPSPPYRFTRTGELGERAGEVLALVRPHVEDVGRILMPGTGDSAVFQGGELVEFTVTVATTHGVTDHEDLVCGVQLVDLDAEDDGRIPIDEATFAVQVHPSGRLRYKLGLPSIEPGRYRVRVAFAVKDSGDEPKAARADLEVRPPPGYVPPRKDPPPPTPLQFPGGQAADEPGDLLPPPEDEPPSDDEPLTDPSVYEDEEERGEVVQGVFPRPVAPPEDDDDDVTPPPLYEHPSEDEEAPVPAPRPPTSRSSAATPIAPPPPSPPPALQALPDPPLVDEGERLDTEELIEDTDAVDLYGDSPEAGFGPPPDAADDLPGWEQEQGASLPGPLARLAEALKRDTYVAVGAAVAASLVLVLVLSLLLRAC